MCLSTMAMARTAGGSDPREFLESGASPGVLACVSPSGPGAHGAEPDEPGLPHRVLARAAHGVDGPVERDGAESLPPHATQPVTPELQRKRRYCS